MNTMTPAEACEIMDTMEYLIQLFREQGWDVPEAVNAMHYVWRGQRPYALHINGSKVNDALVELWELAEQSV